MAFSARRWPVIDIYLIYLFISAAFPKYLFVPLQMHSKSPNQPQSKGAEMKKLTKSLSSLFPSSFLFLTISFSFVLISTAEPNDPLIITSFGNPWKSFRRPKPEEPAEPQIILNRVQKQTYHFLFPETQSKVLPDPARFFSSHLLSQPLPTNSFFQNFVIYNGTQPEYIHPYLIKSSLSSLSLCYPSILSNSSLTTQIFKPDLTISALKKASRNSTHVVSSFSDLSVTLDFPSSNLRFFLVRGSPFLTFKVTGEVELLISTIHSITGFSCNSPTTKCTIKLDNHQTWLLYASSPIHLSRNTSTITSGGFSGIIRIALLPGSDPRQEAVLDGFSSSYPKSGDAELKKNEPFSVMYNWEKKGRGDLLMLAHPLHLRLLSKEDTSINVLDDFKYRSIDGELVGVVGDSWVLKTDPVSVTWHSMKGVKEESRPEIIKSLRKDVEALNPRNISTNSSYFYGKRIARAARLALIAEEVRYPEVIPKIQKFLKAAIEPWLDGTFPGNGFLDDRKWGGMVTKQGAYDSTADFGFGIFNDHHFHLGYFLYTIAALARFDPSWGRRYQPQAYSMVEDFMNMGGKVNPYYPRLRSFDLWKLHSWAAGLTEFPNGRNQESTSEAVNAYYSAALLGLAYEDSRLVAFASTLLAMEIQSAQTWWHVKKGSHLYGEKFAKENRVVGILWANQREGRLWFAPPELKPIRLGIQVLPLLPITRALFSDVGYAEELVEWSWPALSRPGVDEGWKGFVYALEGLYDREAALIKIRKLNGFDDGNSFTNLLWWIHS